MDNAETLESRLAALRNAGVERLPQLAALHERLFAELTEAVMPGARAIGDRAPEIELQSATGDRPVRLSWLLDSGPVILSFYRGHWCPYSNVQLSSLSQAYPQIQSLGASMLYVGPETHQNAAKMRAKWDAPFPVLYDDEGRAMDAFGVGFEMPDYLREDYASLGFPDLNPGTSWRLPIPATFLIDQLGVIRARHLDPDFSRRAEPADILAALRRIKPRLAA
jgi:peroxiredoxin